MANMITLGVRMTLADYLALKQEADLRKWTVSQTVREAVLWWVEIQRGEG